MFDEYTPYIIHGQRRSRYGRTPGGIAVFVRNTVSNFVHHYKTSEFGIYLKINNVIVNGVITDIIIACLYIPCEGSSFYNSRNEDNGLEEISDELERIRDDSTCLIVMGDLNARTSEMPDYIINDDVNYLSLPDWWSDSFSLPRKSRDKNGPINRYGRSLIDLCKKHEIHMLNGRSPNDPDGEFTFCAPTGQSVVDYIIISSSLFDYVRNFQVGSRDESDHFPLSCIIDYSVTTTNTQMKMIQTEVQSRLCYRWEQTKRDEYRSKLIDQTSIELLEHCNQQIITGDVNGALACIMHVFYRAAESMKTGKKPVKQNVNKRLTNKDWWDRECQIAKISKESALRKYRLVRTPEALELYI